MNKVTMITRNVKNVVAKHSPEILTVLGIAGMVTTTILAVRATPKALQLIEEQKCKKTEESADLTLPEKAKTAWKCYIPAAATGIASVACLVGANSISLKRQAALATAYTLSETAMKEYQEKVVETVGEKKEQTIKEAVAKSRIEKNPVSSNEIIVTPKGDTLCYDVISGRYFKSNIDKIRRIENELNREMRDAGYISLNEFYSVLGLNNIAIGDDLGWNIDSGYIDLRFSSQLADDGTPCLVLDYSVGPQYNYFS